MESKSKKDGVKIYSSDFTVPTKDVKEQRGYPNLEESKALSKHNKYLQKPIKFFLNSKFKI